jgi:pimeloyl-ACP methyl ester carboxylesterase
MRVVRRGCLGALLVTLCLPACGTQAATSCAGRFAVAAHLALPYCTNRPLRTRDTGVRRLVIVVHGTQRNASDYERFMLAAARAAHVRDALVVAPRFSGWSSEGWKQGDGSRSSPSVSSFAALDRPVAGIVRSHRFPGLRQVVVAGHSAGGQFVERYAASTRLSLRVPVRYVVANPSSYLYLTPERPVRGSTHRFAVPRARGCRGYDDYKYGLRALNPYLAAVGAARVKAQFATRRVTYLLGGRDTDPHDSSLDTSCAGELQGAFRLQRGEAFFNYLGHVYGPRVYATQAERIVPGVAHDAAAMFRSPVGRRVLFGRA